MGQTRAELIRPKLLLDILSALLSVHAPSQTVSYTRGVSLQICSNARSGRSASPPTSRVRANTVVRLTAGEPRVWFFAHADEISYLVRDVRANGTVGLLPFCSHRSAIESPAITLRWVGGATGEVVARGVIRTEESGSVRTPIFVLDSGNVRRGDRVVYDTPLVVDGDLLRCHVDNAAGMAACLSAILALQRLGADLPVAFAFTDEEEGPALSNATFARGARRLISRIASPDLCVVVDGHDFSHPDQLPAAALYAEYSSNAAGSVVPPHLYAAMRSLAGELQGAGIQIQENSGYVSRSDDVACYEMTPNVLLLGYGVTDPHFNTAVPAASLPALVNLAHAIGWLALRA